MKEYKCTESISSAARGEAKRILVTHREYTTAPRRPGLTVEERRRRERAFAKDNPPILFRLKEGDLLIRASYAESRYTTAYRLKAYLNWREIKNTITLLKKIAQDENK